MLKIRQIVAGYKQINNFLPVVLCGIVVMATVGCWVDAVVFMLDTAVEGMVERVGCVVRVAVKITDCHSSNNICVQKK